MGDEYQHDRSYYLSSTGGRLGDLAQIVHSPHDQSSPINFARLKRSQNVIYTFRKKALGYRVIHFINREYDVKGLMQDCSISSALAMEILQSCTKPSMWSQIAQ